MLRKNNIRKIPSFRRNVIQKKVPLSWRKPKGLFNKRRNKGNCKGKMVKIGYGQNKEYKYKLPLVLLKNNKPVEYHPKELTLVKRVRTLSDLTGLTTEEKQCVIISGDLGRRKKTLIINQCLKLGIRIFPSQLLKLKK